MADPAPVASTFLVDESIRVARLDGIVTLVDAAHIEQHLDEQKPLGVVNEAAAQVAFADRLLLNKADLVADADLVRIEARLRAINAVAPLQRCRHSQVDVDSVLGIRGFDLDRALQVSPQLSTSTRRRQARRGGRRPLDQGAARHAPRRRASSTWNSPTRGCSGCSASRAPTFSMKGVLATRTRKRRSCSTRCPCTLRARFRRSGPTASHAGSSSSARIWTAGAGARLRAVPPPSLRAKAAALRCSGRRRRVQGRRRARRRGTVVNSCSATTVCLQA